MVGDQVTGPRRLERHPPDPGKTFGEKLVGPIGDHRGDAGVGRTAAGRIVFESAVAGWVVRRGDDDAVGEHTRVVTVEGEDRVTDRRGGRERVTGRRAYADPVRDEHLQRAAPCRDRQQVGVETDEQRPGDPRPRTVFDDRLRRRQDVILVERVVQTRSAMPGGTEHDLLQRIRRIGLVLVVGPLDGVDVDQIFG